MEGLGVVVVVKFFDSVNAKIFDYRMHFNREPLPKHGQGSTLRPSRRLGVPTMKFTLEDPLKDLLKNLTLLCFRLVLWNEIDRLLPLNIWQEARVIKLGCPFEEWLRRADYQCSAIQHG
jgi:hypothetical protein